MPKDRFRRFTSLEQDVLSRLADIPELMIQSDTLNENKNPDRSMRYLDFELAALFDPFISDDRFPIQAKGKIIDVLFGFEVPLNRFSSQFEISVS